MHFRAFQSCVFVVDNFYQLLTIEECGVVEVPQHGDSPGQLHAGVHPGQRLHQQEQHTPGPPGDGNQP